ncbi:MAG TPA: cell division protein ZapB [Thermoanaerobaculia bacterium]|nr:cell division protein ZapB [Thermoanaerobaculia bacterium]
MKKTRDADQNRDQMTLAGTEEAEILARLSERVEKAVGTIQELRRERDQLRARVEELEALVEDNKSVEEEQDRLQKERGEIRNRIESILASLEALETE